MVWLKTNPATKFPVKYFQVDQYHDLVSDATVETLGAGTKAYVGVHCRRHGGWTTELPLCAMTSVSIPVNRL